MVPICTALARMDDVMPAPQYIRSEMLIPVSAKSKPTTIGKTAKIEPTVSPMRR